ncbi:hypothetical protein K2X89_11205 [Myxococcota bacterium]|nr:hypothetical protein [Myxococcota bacterium]
MTRGSIGARPAPIRRCAAVLGLALLLALPRHAARAEEPAFRDPALEARIQALEDERAGVEMTGPIVGVVVGAVALQGGLSMIVSTQYNCPGYWHCTDETRWGLTAGSGAAIVVGAITLAIMGPRLSERLEARRKLQHEIHRLRMESGAIGARKPTPSFDWGLALDDRRQAFRATIRF